MHEVECAREMSSPARACRWHVALGPITPFPLRLLRPPYTTHYAPLDVEKGSYMKIEKVFMKYLFIYEAYWYNPKHQWKVMEAPVEALRVEAAVRPIPPHSQDTATRLDRHRARNC